MKLIERRTLLKKVFGVLGGAFVVGGCSESMKRTNESSLFPHDTRKVERGIDRLVEDVNFYFYAVFTHVLSLRKRRCLTVDIRAVKEASYPIIAIMNKQLKDFEITEWKIEEGYGKIDYSAVFVIDNTWTEKIESSFYFGLLGKPGDPVWVEKNAGRYSIGPDGKVRYLSLQALDCI